MYTVFKFQGIIRVEKLTKDEKKELMSLDLSHGFVYIGEIKTLSERVAKAVISLFQDYIGKIVEKEKMKREGWLLERKIAILEKERYLLFLEVCNGNISKTAREMKIDRRTLYRAIERMNIDIKRMRK